MAGQGGSRAAVVGAGIVGLSVAWFLQEEGFEVTVFDARGVAGGASAGNAGWITPGMVSPLPEPGMVGYALRSLVRRDSPLRVTPAALPATARFLASFALNCTQARWQRGVGSLAGICALALSSYDLLERGGVTAELWPSPIVMAFEDAAEAVPVEHELRVIGEAGGALDVTELSQRELREERPVLSARARHGLKLEGQRYLQPLAYTHSLAESFRSRGGQITSGARIDRVESASGGKLTVIRSGERTAFDVAVLASGAWLSQLGKSAGVRRPLAAGRGYSFTVATAAPLAGPLYLPSLRIACTPAPEGMRLAGTMEFRSADAPLDRRRIEAIVRSAKDYLEGVDWASISGLWVGPRPVTADGLPLIGATRQAGVYVAGGHGMWGMTLGPATGRLLAEFITTGEPPAALCHFDPCR
ncbi:MAG TPA: FAD-binding oxidoreductase [Streptosporangiaceae bacterium]|nr:FAD-binding oxidoreductase [Streptosporangiaceae bacterium]